MDKSLIAYIKIEEDAEKEETLLKLEELFDEKAFEQGTYMTFRDSDYFVDLSPFKGIDMDQPYSGYIFPLGFYEEYITSKDESWKDEHIENRGSWLEERLREDIVDVVGRDILITYAQFTEPACPSSWTVISKEYPIDKTENVPCEVEKFSEKE